MSILGTKYWYKEKYYKFFSDFGAATLVAVDTIILSMF